MIMYMEELPRFACFIFMCTPEAQEKTKKLTITFHFTERTCNNIR